jgi:folate-binding protein YgfZ
MTFLTHLPDRGVIEIAGEDRVSFLQGLVSNDVALAAPGRAIWAALLTPQGKWLADFFIVGEGDRLLLDCARAQIAMLVPRLNRHRLRAKVTVADRSGDLAVAIAWGGGRPDIADALVAADPRLAEAGWRILSPARLDETATPADWDEHRLALGLPDGAPDLEAEKSVLLEAGFDELNGISWTKGCYMGQELTARTRYRGLVKRRLVPVAFEGAPPAPGTPVTRDGVEIGTMRSGRPGKGLALLRLEALHAAVLDCGGARLVTRVPGWMRLPEAVAAASD